MQGCSPSLAIVSSLVWLCCLFEVVKCKCVDLRYQSCAYVQEGMFNNANVLFRTRFVDGTSTVTRYSIRDSEDTYLVEHCAFSGGLTAQSLFDNGVAAAWKACPGVDGVCTPRYEGWGTDKRNKGMGGGHPSGHQRRMRVLQSMFLSA